MRRLVSPNAALRRQIAQRSRDLRAVPCAPRPVFRRVGFPANGFRTRMPSRLLSRGLYSADGQMLDEVYNYGSFKQSKMFAAGVTCSDCHDPAQCQASASWVTDVCLQCHSSGKYASSTHRHHEGVNPPLACASCHMPVRTYMVVDPRHDHSFRMPRPDLSVKLGTPNACNDCHTDKISGMGSLSGRTVVWAEPEGVSRLCRGIPCGVDGPAECGKHCSQPSLPIVMPRHLPAPVRSTELSSRVLPSNISSAQNGLTDPDPMVRIGALDMLQGVPPPSSGPWFRRSSSDRSRGVRIRAVSLLADVPTEGLTMADREQFEPRRGRVHRCAATECRPARSALRACEASMRSAATFPRRKRNTRPRCSSAHNMHLRRSILRIFIGNSDAIGRSGKRLTRGT